MSGSSEQGVIDSRGEVNASTLYVRALFEEILDQTYWYRDRGLKVGVVYVSADMRRHLHLYIGQLPLHIMKEMSGDLKCMGYPIRVDVTLNEFDFVLGVVFDKKKEIDDAVPHPSRA